MLRASSSDPTTYTLSSVAGKRRKKGREEERKGGEENRKGRGGRKGGEEEGEGRRKERGGGRRGEEKEKIISFPSQHLNRHNYNTCVAHKWGVHFRHH